MGEVSWHVDDSPPTPWTRVYVWLMWLARDKQAFEGADHTRETALERQSADDRPPTWWTRRRLQLEHEHRADLRVWRVRPRRSEPRVRVLYLHGGGYVHPLTKDYWRLVRALASAPAEVVVPADPLAPGATVDEVLPLLTDLAEDSTRGLPLVVMGDSAGGALTLSIGVELRERGVHPAALVGLSPWLDATLDESEVRDLEATDPMLAESGLRAAGRWWARPHPPTDPRVSPVDADLSGLPPIHVLVGRRDILRPAVDRLADRVRETDGARLVVRERTAMFHVWMTRFIPEGRATRQWLRSFVISSSFLRSE